MKSHPPLRQPKLVFSPLAWLKLQYFCHRGDTEVGGFGITAPGQPLYIEEFVTLPQDTTAVSVAFRDDAVADFFDRSVDRKLSPDRFARIWLHTHPGASVIPSGTDEETYARVFGRCDWAVMAILGRTGNTYARLSHMAGPKTDLEIATAVDWAEWPAVIIEGPSLEVQTARWAADYAAHINAAPIFDERLSRFHTDPFAATDQPWLDDWSWIDAYEDDIFNDSHGASYDRYAMSG